MASFTNNVARPPFKFPFHPPALALPVSRADFLTRQLSSQQKESYIGGATKVIAGAMGAAALFAIYGRILGVRAARLEREAAEQARAAAAAAAEADASSTEGAAADHEERALASDIGAPSFASPGGRRATMPPESHIDSLRKKPRASQLGSPARPAAPAVTPTAPFSLGIITPRTLARYGELLRQGFAEVLTKEAAASATSGSVKGDQVISRVELLIPTEEESHAAFRARVSALKLDVHILQYHGSEQEDVVAFLDYGYAARILLLHRPEEIVERHQQHRFKQDQYNVVTLLREVECAVVFGEGARAGILKLFPANQPGNVCVVPHGFSALDEGMVNKTRKLAPVAVAGGVTTFNDMRWVADLLQLNQTIRQYSGNSKSSTPSKKASKPPQIVVYGAGHFQSYTDPSSKAPIDELALLSERFPEKIVVQTREQWEQAEKEGKYSDVNGLKAYLWEISEHGEKIVLSNSGQFAFDSPLHSQVFDFSTQLFREHLKNFAPKVEYGGALHAQPGAAIPIVFESPAMADCEIEGLQLITVPYGGSGSCCSAKEFPACCPWYAEQGHCPDFAPAVDTMVRYIANPSHYQSHRQSTLAAARELTMRHVAMSHKSIVASIMGL
jgi:hypothetical protein